MTPPAEAADLAAVVDQLCCERGLAEQRIIVLEREVERLRGALRDVVEQFTRPDLPDGPEPTR